MPIAELQSEWIADVLVGKAALPDAATMREEIAAEEEAMRRRYVASTRHTIQVDFHPYMRLLRRERRRTEGVLRPLGAASAIGSPDATAAP
jgi:dimethylaniline monooxygenase (N-oxide forming)